MHCPKCENQNPDDAQVCYSCSFALTSPTTEQPKQKSKRMKFPFIFSSLLFLAGILILFLKPVSAFIASIFALCSAIAAVPEILQKSKKQKKNMTMSVIAIVLLILLSFFAVISTYFCIDAAPIPNDYTLKNLKSAAPKYSETFNLLNNLSDERNQNTGYAIGFSKEDFGKYKKIENIFKQEDIQDMSRELQENEETIFLLWEKTQKGRDIFTKLNSFPEIADLTKPKLEIDIKYLANIRYLAYVYHSYIRLQSIKGNHETAINELMRFDSLFKKMNLYAHNMTIKLVCIACFALDIKTANCIINNPETPTESLLALKEHIIPFSTEDTSLRNSLMFEYLIYKNETIKVSNTKGLKRPYFSPLKSNSSLRLYRNIIDKWIADEDNRIPPKKMRVWPAIYPNLPVTFDKEGKIPWYYRSYNPAGFLLVKIFRPALERILVIRKKLQVHAEMLQIVLGKRLGEKVSLKALAYSDEYIIDIEKRLIFSPGPDGPNNTKDDIKLSINPKLLGWNNQEKSTP
ncbi:MAG: zinc ribbon domain-containing protein [Planctomycetes bacterium]|nr:zinc ribbon domain-containing protein [Planctomycetota bacterium]